MRGFWNKCKFFLILLNIFMVGSLLIYVSNNFIYFPNKINLTENISHRFNFNLPIEAIIEPETVSALTVNSEPVKDNITVSLGKPLTIEASEAGTAQMTLNAFGFPLKRVTLDVKPPIELVPCGMTIGVRINTDGVMVLGTGYVNGEDGSSKKPAEGKLLSGDLIINANGSQLNNKEDLMDIVEKSDKEIALKVKRDQQLLDYVIEPVKSIENKQNKIGVWVRDSTQGIGTITYYNPLTNKFAALGHGILDVDTKKIMSVKDGTIMESDITSVKKGNRGSPGELVGDIKTTRILGEITSNSPFGIYGRIDVASLGKLPSQRMKISLQDEVHEGPATIRSNVEGSEVKDYDVFIESVNRFSTDNTKGMVLKITDPKLIGKTNGIVQGMSGSPIIQDGKIAGAVTHVFVQDPTKGYGIFIENMLNEERKSR